MQTTKKTPLTTAEKLARMNILVLDGGAKAATLIKAIFNGLGLTNVFVAHDGQHGVQIMKEIRLHMIFTDWELKIQSVTGNAANEGGNVPASANVEGTKLVERIRRSATSPNPFIPIVMMMDSAQEQDVIKARDSGVNEVLLRPIHAEDFCEKLISLIDKPRAFITAPAYKGPCRRINKKAMPANFRERRVHEVRLIKSISR